MGEVKYSKVNATALKAVMRGFIAEYAITEDSDETLELLKIFENMVLEYLKEDTNEQKEEE